MDMEQRIGRIHRYGQKDTAQVYNLVLSDTIEGSIFLLLTEKLEEIGKALGKVDAEGNVTEDLRSQILGQLSDRLSYDQLYRNALSDPELKRTRQELEAAMSNANEARKVVYELFQDLDRFTLDDYKPLADINSSKKRILEFVRSAVEQDGGTFDPIDDERVRIIADRYLMTCTLDRDLAQNDESLELLGLDHPMVVDLMNRWRSVDPTELGATAAIGTTQPSVLTLWLVQGFDRGADSMADLVAIAVDRDGKRIPSLEKRVNDCFHARPGLACFGFDERVKLLENWIEPALQRELQHRGIASMDKSYASKLLAWLEVQ